jgi:hypothetical protein
MTRSIGTRAIVAALCLSVPWLGFSQAASAAVVTTQQYLQLQSQESDAAGLRAWLATDAVRAQLLGLGVAPEAVEARIAALTPDEQRLLTERIGELPAGGDVLAVIGVVFVVLLILELVGVIDIFKKT